MWIDIFIVSLFFIVPIPFYIGAYRAVIDGGERFPAACIMILMMVMIGFGAWLPFLIDRAHEDRDQFDLDCHARGGSVVETKNTGYECWTERIDLNEPSVY